MKNKHILKALSLLAALCIAAGCRGSTTVETTVGTGTQAETSTVSETTKAAESVSAEVEELEVDHVDEDGIVYYKNPTEWTYEKFFSELTINGKSIEAPLTLEKMGEGFTIDESTIGIDTEKRLCTAQILYNNNLFAQVRFKDVDDTNNLSNKEIDIIFQLFSSHTDKECFDILKISNIGMGSAKDDIAALGNVYGEADYISIFDNNSFSFQFDKEEAIELILINFEAMKRE